MNSTSCNPLENPENDLKPEYNFDYKKAKKYRFAEQLDDSTLTVVVLDEDIAQVFKTPEAVNNALRTLIQASK